MDPTISDLIKGPSGQGSLGQIDWLYRIHQALADSADRETREIGVPIKEAADLLAGLKDAPKEKQEEARYQVDLLLLRAKGLAIYSHLVKLNRLKDAIAEDTSKKKKGSSARERGEKLTQAYEKTFSALARAYEDFRQGKAIDAARLSSELAAAQSLIERSPRK